MRPRAEPDRRARPGSLYKARGPSLILIVTLVLILIIVGIIIIVIIMMTLKIRVEFSRSLLFSPLAESCLVGRVPSRAAELPGSRGPVPTAGTPSDIGQRPM